LLMNETAETKQLTKADLRKIIEPLVQEYLKEINSPMSVREFLQEQSIVPIRVNEKLVGFWGLHRHRVQGSEVATVKAFYLQPEFRGEHLNDAADDLIRTLIREGITHLEIWAFPKIQRWLTRRYGIKPRIHVSQAPIEVFKVYE
jgi:hypothetical protein